MWKEVALFASGAAAATAVFAWLRRRVSPPAASDASPKAIVPETAEAFHVGDIRTSYFVTQFFEERRDDVAPIECICDSPPVPLPEELEPLRQSIEREQEQAKRDGRSVFWNGGTYGLSRISRRSAVAGEASTLTLHLFPSDYFSYLAVISEMDCSKPGAGAHASAVRAKYLVQVDAETVVPALARSVGVSTLIVTRDERALLTRRKNHLSCMPGFFSVSINEAMTRDPNAPDHLTPDPAKTIVQGALEELGLTLDPSQIRFLSFGVDETFYQWGIASMAEVRETAAEIREGLSLGTKDGTFENDALYFAPFSIPDILDFVRNNGPWVCGGLAALTQALVLRFGREAVVSAARAHRQ
jgi:hypothetical protein